MKKFKITLVVVSDEETANEMKNSVLSGEMQRKLKKGSTFKEIQSVKVTYEELIQEATT